MTWTWYRTQDMVPYTFAKYSLFFEGKVRTFIEAKFLYYLELQYLINSQYLTSLHLMHS